MKPREQLIVTALINTIKQKVYTVYQIVLMAEDFYNRHMLTEEALEELYDRLDKMNAECYTCEYAYDNEETAETLCTKAEGRLCIDWCYLSREGSPNRCPLKREL